jgi:hypothetical protein
MGETYMRLNNVAGCYLLHKNLGNIYEQLQDGVKYAGSTPTSEVVSTFYDSNFVADSHYFMSDHWEILV